MIVKTAKAAPAMRPAKPYAELGPGRGHRWRVNPTHVDMAVPPPPPRPFTFKAKPQKVTVDLERSAIIIIDMQNDFCAKGGWVDYLGADYTPDRAPIKPLQKLLPALREAGMPVIWVNWGNRPDLMNMAPNQIHLYKPKGSGIGLSMVYRTVQMHDGEIEVQSTPGAGTTFSILLPQA